MNNRDQLREQMWDYVYGLLSRDESKALIAQIKSDPQAARLYAEVRLQSDLVGAASLVEDSSVVLRPDVTAEPTAAKREAASPAVKSSAASELRRVSRSGSWLLGVAATALAVLLSVGFLWPQPNERQIAAHFVAADIETPPAMPAGLTNTIALKTYFVSHDGEATGPAPAQLDVRLRKRDGEEVLHRQVNTNERGWASFECPGSALQPGVSLEVVPQSQADQRLTAAIPVREEPQIAYLLSEEPALAPGKTNKFALWAFNAFSNNPVSPADAQGAALDLAEQAQAQPQWTADQKPGVVSGTLEGPPTAAPGASSVVLQNSAIYSNDSRSQLTLQQAQATPVRGNERFQQAGERGSQTRQRLVQAKDITQLVQRSENLAAGQRARAAQSVPEAAADAGGLPLVEAGQPIDLEVPGELAGRPLLAAITCRGVTVAAESLSADRPLSEEPADKEQVKQLGQKIRLDVPQEADGVMEVALYDRSSTPPQLVGQDVFYREPARKLNIDLAEAKQQYKPGEAARVTMQVTDEKNQPAAGVQVSVRMWNEAVVQQAPEQALLLTDVVRNNLVAGVANAPAQNGVSLVQSTVAGRGVVAADELRLKGGEASLAYKAKTAELSKEREAADAKSETKAEAKAALAADSFQFGRAGAAGAFGTTPPAEPQAEAVLELPVEVVSPEPIQLASNRAVVQAKVNAAIAEARQRRQSIVRAIGGVAIAGGVLLGILIATLALQRAVGSKAIAVSAVALAAASLFLGFVWLGGLPHGDFREVAMTMQQERDEMAPPDGGNPGEAEVLEESMALGTRTTPLRDELARQPDAGLGVKTAEDLADRVDAAAVPPPSPSSTPVPAIQPSEREQRLGEALKDLDKDVKKNVKEVADGVPAVPAAAGPLVAGGLAGAARPAPPAGGYLPGQDQQAGKGAAEVGRRLAAIAPSAAGRQAGARTELGAAAVAGASAAPASLYFNPDLVTDSNGRATIEFVMPTVNSEYRLLIDALGNGRIGSRQEVLVCRDND
jgi:hypothetical protein